MQTILHYVWRLIPANPILLRVVETGGKRKRDLVFRCGYLGILVALETIFPPIPSEVILPFSGFLTGQGRLSFLLVLTATTTGSLVGALLLYSIGARVGKRRVHRLVATYGQWALLTPADLARAEAWFNRAYALERLGLADEAREAWQAYLTIDDRSGWADEARTHLRALKKQP